MTDDRDDANDAFLQKLSSPGGAPPPPSCPSCGSQHVTAGNKGFRLGNAAKGAVLLGPVGLLGGVVGSKKLVLSCMSCGTQWEPSPPSAQRKPSQFGRVLGILFLCFLGVLVLIAVASRQGAATNGATSVVAYVAPPAPAATDLDDLGRLVAQYGRPDVDDSTANDQPQPPIVTRWFVYKREHVRVTFLPDLPVGTDARLARRWKLMAFQDERTNQPISATEASKRLTGRGTAAPAAKGSAAALAAKPTKDAGVALEELMRRSVESDSK